MRLLDPAGSRGWEDRDPETGPSKVRDLGLGSPLALGDNWPLRPGEWLVSGWRESGKYRGLAVSCSWTVMSSADSP